MAAAQTGAKEIEQRVDDRERCCSSVDDAPTDTNAKDKGKKAKQGQRCRESAGALQTSNEKDAAK